MSFEGPMLAASIVRALAALPGAIRDLRALLSGPKLDASAAVTQLDGVRVHLIQLCEASDFLKEAKEVHNALHHLYTELEYIRSMSRSATQAAQFQPTEYPVAKVRETWARIRSDVLLTLLVKAESIRYIEPAPLVLDAKDAFVSGPLWIARYIELRDAIDAIFEKSRSVNPRQLNTKMTELDDHTKARMMEADQRIISEALAFGRALHQMKAALAT